MDKIKTLNKDQVAKLKSKVKPAKAIKEETTVDVLLDSVQFTSKPVDEAAAITNRLPQNKQTITLEDLAQAVSNGCSWKASVLSDTNNGSFVSSSLVALDIDNKDYKEGEVYTSINDFLVQSNNSKYQPCFLYETFSSTEELNKYRVVYAFDKTITDYNEMVALYEEVKAQYPTVDIDESVHPGKVLFGGKALSFFNNVVNETPEVKAIEKAARTSKPSNVKETNYDSIVIDKDTVLEKIHNLLK